MAKIQKKGLTQKQIGIAIAAFAVLFLGGIVFAATSGVMNINGAVSRGANVDLDFAVASCSLQTTSGVPAGGGISLTGIGSGDYNCGISIGDHAGTNGANDVLNWGVFLRSPGDTVTITFSISNVGAVDALLNAINISTQTGFGTAPGQINLSGSGTTIPSQTIPVGQTAGPYQITVTWPAGDATATDGATFAATLDYAQAP
jgi:hypothetical protein